MSLCGQRLDPCQGCGDKVIHQCNRQPHESSSAFGQHLHDDLPNDFFAMDIDAAVYAHESGLLRVIEHKPRGSGISPGQRTILPMLARALTSIERAAVWVVRSNYPFASGNVARVLPEPTFTLDEPVDLTGDSWYAFKRARYVRPS